MNAESTNVAAELEQARARIADLERECARHGGDADALRASEEKFRMLVEASPICIKLVDITGHLLSMNRAGLDMIGETNEADIIGRSYMNVVCAEDYERVDQLLLRAIAGEPAEFQFLASVGRHFSSNFMPIVDAAGNVTRMLSMTEDVTERVNAEALLRASEQRFRLVTRATRDAIYDVDLVTGTTWRNHVYQEEYGTEETSSQVFWEQRVHPEDRSEVDKSVRQCLDGDSELWSSEYRFRRTDGSYAAVVDRALIMRNDEGKPIRMIGAMADITAQRTAERYQQLIVNELDHRVKNNLSSVLALLVQTRATAGSLDQFTRTFEGRISALACSHEMLAATSWNDYKLHDVLKTVIEPYMPMEQGRLHIIGENVSLPARSSRALTLTLHELTTNALKHGAFSNETGQIEFEALLSAPDRFEMTWRETGGPQPGGPIRAGVGIELIRGMVEFELKGTVDLDLCDQGLSCHIQIPLNANAGDDRASSLLEVCSHPNS